MDYKLLQIIVEFLGLISIILLFWQIRSGLKWNKIQFSLNRFDKKILMETIKEISNSGINISEKTLSEDDYKIIVDEQNIKYLYKIQSLLNMFEDFSILYNMNLLDNHFVYEAYSENVIFYYSKFKRIIEYCREHYSDMYYYTNLEKCAGKFIRRNAFER
jgi:hypothetical protein